MLPCMEIGVYWIFGLKSNTLNLVIWITNFAIYKSHLVATDRKRIDPKEVFLQECYKF